MVLLAAAFAAGVLGFVVDLRPGPWTVAIAFLAQTVYLFAVLRRDVEHPTRIVVGVVVATALLLVVAAAVLGHVHDLSVDGQHYQGESIRKIAAGWNPLFSHALPSPFIYTNSYTKAPWVLEAIVTRSGGDFESSTVIAVPLILAAFGLVFTLLRTLGMRRFWGVALAAVIALNPVAVIELSQHMVDGIFASVIVVTAALLLLYFAGYSRAAALVPLAASIALLVNVKATGLVILAFVVVAPLLVIAWRRRWPSGTRVLVGTVVVSAIAGVVGLGFNPYVTNTLRHGNPLYPEVASSRSDSIERTAVGPALADVAAPVRLLVSLASRSGSTKQLKVPLFSTPDEWKEFTGSVPKLGGFGPLFSGALLFGFAAAVGMVVGRRRRSERVPERSIDLIVVAGGCIVSALVISVASNARLAPQVWLVPPLLAAAALLGTEGRLIRVVAGITVALLAVNLVLVSGLSLRHQVNDSRRLDRNLSSLRAASRPWLAEFGTWAIAERHLLEANGVRFRTVGRSPCTHPQHLQTSGQMVPVDVTKVGRPLTGVLLCRS